MFLPGTWLRMGPRRWEEASSLAAILVPTLFWSDLTNHYVWIVLLTTLGFGLLGFWDDYKKVRDKKGIGIRARYKFPIQVAMGLVVSLVLFYTIDHDSRLIFPFFKKVMPDLGEVVHSLLACSSSWVRQMRST